MSLYDIKHNVGYLPSVRMGVIIENKSQKDKSVWFLGTKKNNYKEMDGVLVSNMFSDTFLDDNSLTMLKNWLISKGQIIIAVTRLTADEDINFSFGDELLINDGKDINSNMAVLYIKRYFSPHQFQHGVLDISEQILVDAFTSFNVSVKSNSKVGIVFFPSNNIHNAKTFNGNDFDDMYSKIKETNKDMTEKNKKRYLLLLR